MAIVRKDKLNSGYHGVLESVKIFNNAGNNKVQSTNGVFVVLEGLLEGRECKKARLASEADADKTILFIHNSEYMYDERDHKLKDFRIEADKVARAYRLEDGDVLTLTNDLFAGATKDSNSENYSVDFEVGDVLVVKSNGKLGKVDDASDAKFKFTVIENSGYELDPEMEAHAVEISVN